MKAAWRVVGGIVLLVLGAGAGVGVDRLWLARREPAGKAGEPDEGAKGAKPAEEEDEPEPAAMVRTAVARAGALPREIRALGVAAMPPTGTSVEAWPSDVLVMQVMVQPGQMIQADAPLLRVEPTGQARAQLASAELARQSAEKALAETQKKLEHGLATRGEVLAAQAGLDDATQKVEQLRSMQPPADGLLRAGAPGSVSGVLVQPGATALAGTPLVQITSGTPVAMIGLEPAEASAMQIGQRFTLRGIDDRATHTWQAHLALLSPVVNPATRLVDATLEFDDGPPPRPGVALRATATLGEVAGVVVPREALIPDGNEMVVYVIRDGAAVRRAVTTLFSGRDEVVLAKGCEAGEHVVISGQDQLAQGDTVREVTTPQPAHDAPSDQSGGDSDGR
ncbi:MAG: efflux RND transporter periplasmic adaptor subunit [Tepidisphaera sp.]|nr:efflux RND transporter periplasmic adaptor subunit [Tepidisphaera sp.]